VLSRTVWLKTDTKSQVRADRDGRSAAMKNDLNWHDVLDTELAIHDAEFLLPGIDSALTLL
jgi:hypothetical protein